MPSTTTITSRIALLILALIPALASADSERAPYHNPRGAIVMNLMLGIGVGSTQTTVAVGAGVGYAVITGVLPGVRGTVIINEDRVAGELATTLTLTPPITFFVTPFAYGELGRRFDISGAWMVAGGPGVYVGDPRDTFVLQVGWIFRRYFFENDLELDGSGPLVSIAVRF